MKIQRYTYCRLIMFAILSDAANAYNAIPWRDAVPFLAILIALYWVKVKIDTRAGIGKKKMKELKRLIREAIDESELIDRMK